MHNDHKIFSRCLCYCQIRETASKRAAAHALHAAGTQFPVLRAKFERMAARYHRLARYCNVRIERAKQELIGDDYVRVTAAGTLLQG